MQGDYATAHSLYEDCLSIFRELGDRIGIAWSLNYQGDVALDQGDSQAAAKLYEESLIIFRELGDQSGIASSLTDLGNLARDQKDFPEAESLYRESLKIFHALDHKRGIARLLECLAGSAAAQSKPTRALRLAGAAAALRQAVGAPLTSHEQAKLERSLEPARQALSKGAKAWLEGWVLPVEKAIEEALSLDSE
jgi:tetratricopeptide (TPR) repeat protein